jgi:hypothetical protein
MYFSIPLKLKNMIFTGKNRKLVNRIWAIVSILAIVGMVGFSLVALFQ